MRVLLFGAGASRAAGYPLAAELIEAIQEHVSTSALLNHSNAWAEWTSYRDRADGLLDFLVRNPNPEVVFSVPDLFEAAIDARDRHEFQLARSAFQSDPTVVRPEYPAYFESKDRIALHDAVIARERLLECVGWFFAFRHGEDGEARSRRSYLRELFSELRPGDMILTLNWDTVAERTLAEMGLWSPVTGYGFRKNLHYEVGFDTHSLPEQFAESLITVLKLHGSFGWLVDKDRIVFEHSRYLGRFDFHADGHRVSLVDPDTPWHEQADRVGFLYPSFLKRFNTPELQEVWYRAGLALGSADRIDIYGYSLPASDTAVRALLSPLRFRAQGGSARVVVHEPNGGVLESWRAFLGEAAEYLQETLPPSS